MKRLLHRNSRRGDDDPASPGAQKKSWVGTVGLSALQQTRERTGNHPQIRHLAMESHEGPVTRATMDEIRREAAASSSNLRINSLALVSPVDADAEANTDTGATEPPLRTTSAAFAVAMPLRIDTAGPADQRMRALAAPRALTSATTDDSDASLAIGTAPAAGYLRGFDSPQSAPHQPQSAHQPHQPYQPDPSKRVISNRIKHLANRFSTAGLDGQPSTPPLPPPPPPLQQAVRRRPSNSPSVSERVSLFDGHDGAQPLDPRTAGIFGKFGMAGGQPSVHSRSSSGTSASIQNAIAQSFAAGGEPHANGGLRRPASMAHATGGFGSPALSSAHGVVDPGPFQQSAAGSAATDSGAERSSLCGAEGAQPAAPRSPVIPDGLVVMATDDDQLSIGYRGVRGNGPPGRPRRRGSLRSTFAAATAAEGLQINTNLAGSPTGAGSSSGLSPSPRAARYADLAPARSPSATASPASTHGSRAASFRRAGSVLPVPPAPAAIAETKRNSSASARESSPAAATAAAMRNRSVSYTPAPRSPAPQAAVADHPRSDDTLFGHLSTLDVPLHAAGLDAVLAGATGAAARLVDTVASTCDAGPVLSPVEYDRQVCDAAALRSKLQSTQTRLSMDMDARDAAKARIDAQKPSSGSSSGMFKGRHSHQAHTGEYSAACDAVKRTEAGVAVLSTELRAVETALHGHQLTVLLAALRTVVSEAASVQSRARETASAMELELAELEHGFARVQAAHAADVAATAAKNAAATQALEEQIRELENRNHDAAARQAAWGSESPSDHSARLDAERLSGELTVVKEQRRDAQVQVTVLEARLDEALLRAREAQASLGDSRRLAAELAHASSVRLEAAQADADSCRQCVQTVTSGLRELVAPLRELGAVHSTCVKLRSANANRAAATSTPPATPPPAVPCAPPAASAEALEALLGSTADNLLGAEQAATVLALVAVTLESCSSLHAEAMTMHGGYVELHRDLGTEKRLREAQGLAIAQQRERLAAASRLAESADQRVAEAADALATTHAAEREQWADERQRLLDNADRLMRDTGELKAQLALGAVAVGSIERASVGPVSPPSTAAAATSTAFDLPSALSAAVPAGTKRPRRLARRWSCSAMHSSGRPEAAQFPNSVVRTRRTDAQTMTGLPVDGMDAMLTAYSDKLVLKEDALRSREEDLEAVRAAAAEIELALAAAAPASATWTTYDHASSLSVHRTRSAAADGVPALVRGLQPLVEMAAAESRRLRGLIGRLESQAQATATELLETRQKHAQLQEHCDVRAGQDDAIHQDIAHVLDQISRLRARVVQLESEKAAFETEAGTLRQRCRELEGESAEQAVQLIVERIGKRDWERRRDAAEATAPAAETSSTASADPTPPSQFSSAGTVAICHPEASDIRAEFNELLHQVIGRRDEDIERMRALADAWRADARRALRANELRTWNSGTRGTQTVSDP